LLNWEEAAGFNAPEVYKEFYERILSLKKQTRDFLEQAKAEGKTVWGYGASTKGNTLLQMFEIDETMIVAIAEKQDFKFGRRTVGTNIPITSEEEMRKAQPDYLLVLPWFFRDTFIERENEYLEKGGAMVFPAPEFSVYSLKDKA
jgi:hypothetical protein